MDSLQSEINIMIARENILLQDRNKKLHNQRMMAPAMLLLLSLMALAVVFIAYWQLNKSLLNAQQLNNEVINQKIQLEKNKHIEASQKELKSLIKQAPVAITLLEGENLLLQVANDTALQLMGKTEQEVNNKPLNEIFPELAERQKIYKQVFNSGIPYEGKEVEVNFNRNGEKNNAYYNLNYLPWYNSEGKIKGVMGVGVDVTVQVLTRKKIQESEERFRSLAQTLPQLVWVTDAQGNAEFASLRWKEFSGIEPGGEEEWRAIVHPDDYDNINAAWVHSLTTGNLYMFDVRLKNKHGEYIWHTAKGEPVLDKENNIVKWVGAFTDIQDQKIIEEKKDEFISIASHEMKTPLTTAKAYLQMLELSLYENNEDANLYAKKASQSVNRLNELISELLDVSKIRLGKLNYTISTFNFTDMVDSTVENLQLTTPTHTIIKNGKVWDEVTGDKERLQQVVINLLTNAIKYSPGAAKVSITMEQENDSIKVSVKDWGIGITQESLTKIFEKYHRVEEHSVHFQGLGIGLFISYEIIQRHHGKLWAESEPGKGSTFYFTIPVNSNLE
jgi:PAS domain S-box-containing protein